MNFIGFKLSGSTVKEVQLELANAEKQIQMIAEDKYHRLLGEEISFLVDCVSLGILTRNPEEDFYEIAEENLRARIFEWNKKNISGRFNFAIYAYLFPYKKDVYMKVEMGDPEFYKAFSYLEDFSLEDHEMEDLSNEKTKIWTEIMDTVKPLITINFSPDPKMKKRRIVYPSRAERIETWARHQVTKERLNVYSSGNQIPSHLLMRYMDAALEDLSEYGEELQEQRMKLSQILIDLEKEENRTILKKGEEEHA